MENSTNKSQLFMAGAIVVAGIFIAGAIVYIKMPASAPESATAGGNATAGSAITKLVPAGPADHIQGSVSAPVIIVEYADTECPYCQQFAGTMKEIMKTYGPAGTNQVAWIYRHFAFHPKAPKEAQATECAAELGGNSAFWNYLDLIFSKKDFSVADYKGLDEGQLPELAGQIGLNKQTFTDCLTSNKYATKVTQEYNDAIAAGAEGTPFTVITTATAKVPVTAGAVPAANLKAAIDTLLNPN
jgi:protein-disulfide isomerase